MLLLLFSLLSKTFWSVQSKRWEKTCAAPKSQRRFAKINQPGTHRISTSIFLKLKVVSTGFKIPCIKQILNSETHQQADMGETIPVLLTYWFQKEKRKHTHTKCKNATAQANTRLFWFPYFSLPKLPRPRNNVLSKENAYDNVLNGKRKMQNCLPVTQ